MKRVLQAGCLILAVWAAGCARIPFLGKPSQPAGVTTGAGPKSLPAEPEISVEKGKIIDAGLLRQGKNVVVIPFKAGVDVAANERLDQIALMIVKGIADTFTADPEGRYWILTAETAEDADLVVQGHVTSLQGPSKMRRWIMLKGFKALGVEGDVVDQKTGETVAVFTDEAKTKTDTYKDLGYQTGKNIGSFILSGAE